jgi:hypothetical protein
VNRLLEAWERIDPKLKYTVLTFTVARLALALGVDWDPATEAVISGALAALVGYQVSNEGTALRQVSEEDAQDSGGLVVPEDADLTGEVPEPEEGG